MKLISGQTYAIGIILCPLSQIRNRFARNRRYPLIETRNCYCKTKKNRMADYRMVIVSVSIQYVILAAKYTNHIIYHIVAMPCIHFVASKKTKERSRFSIHWRVLISVFRFFYKGRNIAARPGGRVYWHERTVDHEEQKKIHNFRAHRLILSFKSDGKTFHKIQRLLKRNELEKDERGNSIHRKIIVTTAKITMCIFISCCHHTRNLNVLGEHRSSRYA